MAAKSDLGPIGFRSKVRLSALDPDGEPAGLKDKSKRLKALAALSEELNELQDLFYAARSHKLLLVLQGMDSSGKDGTIRHVFSTVDPLGVRVASFKAPTPIERDHDFLWRIHAQMPASGE